MKSYLQAWKLNKLHAISLLWDFIAVAGVFLLSKAYLGLVGYQSKVTGQGKSLDALKVDLITQPGVAETLASDVKTMVVYLFAGFVIFFVGSLIIIAYSRMKLWGTLVRPRKNLWKWVSLNLILLVFALIYLIPLLILSLAGWNLILRQAVMISLVVLFIFWVFGVYKKFVEIGKVWEAIGASFKRRKLGKEYLLTIGTVILWGVLLNFLQAKFYFNLPYVFWQYLPVAYVLLILTWMRIYVVSKV
jgi:hypothetical protein